MADPLPKANPLPGKSALYHPGDLDRKSSSFATLGDGPLAATVVHIHDDKHANLAVFDSVGAVHSRVQVPLKEGDKPELPCWESA